MATVEEGTHAAEVVVSEAENRRSRSVGTLTSGEVVVAGQVLATVTGKYVEYDSDGAGTTSTATAVALEAVDATAGDLPIVVLDQAAQVNATKLQFMGDEAAPESSYPDLEALGIRVRTGV